MPITASFTLPLPAEASAAPAGLETVSIAMRGPRNAVIAVSGAAGPDAVRMVEVLLDAALAGGARQVIVDLSAVHGVPGSLRDALVSASWVLSGRGGWLLVEGNAEVGWVEGGGDTEPGPSLLDAFRAYRSAVRA